MPIVLTLRNDVLRPLTFSELDNNFLALSGSIAANIVDTSNNTTSITNLNTSASLAIVSASVSTNTITFRKGNGTTFPISIDIGTYTGFVTTSSFNSFTSSVITTSSFNAFTSSVVTTSSFNSFTSSVVTTSSFNSFTGSVVTTSSFNSFTSSVITRGNSTANQSITGSLTISGSTIITGSFAFSASLGNYSNIVVIDTGSGKLYFTSSIGGGGTGTVTGAGETGYLAYWSGSSTNLSSSILYYSASKFGIGTTTPSGTIELVTAGNNKRQIQFTDAFTTESGIRFFSSNGTNHVISIDSTDLSFYTENNKTFQIHNAPDNPAPALKLMDGQLANGVPSKWVINPSGSFGGLYSSSFAVRHHDGGSIPNAYTIATYNALNTASFHVKPNGDGYFRNNLYVSNSAGVGVTASSDWNLQVLGSTGKFRVGNGNFSDIFSVTVGSGNQGYSDVYLNGQTYNLALYANPQTGQGYTVNSIQYSTASVGLIAGGSSARLVFGTNNVERMRIHTDGDVSIGSQNMNISQSGYRLNVSGSGASGSFRAKGTTNVAVIEGTGSANPIFSVLGSQGELFSVTDSLSGSLFSVNDISGLPILEVFSDNTTLIGSYVAPSLHTTVRTTINTGTGVVIYQVPTASYDGMFVEYTAKSGSVARIGTIMTTFSGSTTTLLEETSSIGTTTAISFGSIITGSNFALSGSATTNGWSVKTIIRSI